MINLLKFFRNLFKTNKKKKTIFGKKLIISVGQTSADDEDGDSSAGYKVQSGKIDVRKLSSRKWYSKDRLDFEIWDTLEIIPKTRTAVINYWHYNYPNTKTYRIRLFREWRKNKGIIKI